MGTNYVVRYGSTRNIAEFSVKSPQSYTRGQGVIVRSDRGTESGEVLCTATDRTRSYLAKQDVTGRILRIATDEDREQLDQILLAAQDEFVGCGEMICERKLQMQLVDVEHLFGGERVVFYYLAEKRVDFRELVRALAKRYHTRIEMRQIGVRDEARLLADYGDCGKPVCCNTHLRSMPAVSMKMAKLQKSSLDPSKISGRCGRLKCCLRYEYDTYVEYRRDLPRIGAIVLTKAGEGKVIGQEILSRKILVLYEGARRVMTDEQDVLTVVKSNGTRSEPRKQSRGDNPDRKQSPPPNSES